jgi:hypothetical protein
MMLKPGSVPRAIPTGGVAALAVAAFAVKIVRVQFNAAVTRTVLDQTDLVLVRVTVTVVGPGGKDVTVTVAVTVTVELVEVGSSLTSRSPMPAAAAVSPKTRRQSLAANEHMLVQSCSR